MSDEFYIGYLARAPRGIGRRVRWVSLVLLLLAGVGAAGLARVHRRLPPGNFEFGTDDREFVGVVLSDPYPTLRVRRPGTALDEQEGWSRYLLVAPGKFGAQDLARGLDGQTVRLQGTLVFQDGRTMVEVRPETVEPVDESALEGAERPAQESLGVHTLVGEIVDSKCHLGVMNPGVAKTHGACARLCIAGGIPPLLLVRDEQGAPRRFLLVSAAGHSVNRDVLDLVAVPVRITGEVVCSDDLLVLRADPATYERLAD